MITIGNIKIGTAPFSMFLVFLAVSTFAVVNAFQQFNHFSPMPLSYLIVINECIALAITLIYGVLLHFAIFLYKRIKGLN